MNKDWKTHTDTNESSTSTLHCAESTQSPLNCMQFYGVPIGLSGQEIASILRPYMLHHHTLLALATATLCESSPSHTSQLHPDVASPPCQPLALATLTDLQKEPYSTFYPVQGSH